MDARSRLLALTLSVCLLGTSDGWSHSAEPERRYVAGERAVVYAGPSEEYYPTSVLKQGDAVDVYEQTEDGWLAIRPPKGSFSWIPATQGFLLPGGRVVEVTDPEAVSWIGSELGTAKQYRWQVRLGRGEQLSVTGEQTLGDPQSDKKTLWYKITPPNGEFRWISADAVTAQAPTKNQIAASHDADADGDRADAGSNVALAAHSDDEGPKSILQASAEDPIDGDSFVSAMPDHAFDDAHEHAPGDSVVQTGADRWNTWHAVEFKNGSFSFPGIARMLGMEPSPTSARHDGYDPFDLASSQTTSRPSPIADDTARALGHQAHAQGDSADMPSGPRKPRAWRDPRQLRDSRQREYAGLSGDLSYSSDAPVGSGVVAASATAMAGSIGGAGDDAQWYGIVQAPQATHYQPLALQQADLSEVQALLSEMVSGPEHTWNLAPLADRTRYLIEHGVTAIERGEARLLLDRIEAFADVARRSTELGMTPPVALPAAMNASISASPIAAAASRWASPLGLSSAVTDASSGSAPRFDATGWVVPVHSTNPDMPTHALTNDTGRIIVYLSSAAGVNLARYQAQAVGVYGLRGYLPQLKANHIQVQRAVRLH